MSILGAQSSDFGTIGEIKRCQTCREEIRYAGLMWVGPQWEHLSGRMDHRAGPKTIIEKPDA